MRLRVGLAAIVFILLLGSLVSAPAATVDITVSNFRCCQREQCLPTDFVSVRNPTGNGLLHQNALTVTLLFRTAVKPGDTELPPSTAGQDVGFSLETLARWYADVKEKTERAVAC